MRQNVLVNHENEDLMNEIMRQMTNIYGKGLNPYMVAKFVGVLLNMKRHGVLDPLDCNNPHLTFDKIVDSGMSDELIAISHETISDVERTINIETFEHIIDFLSFAEFSDGEYLRWYDYFIEELCSKSTPFGQFSAPEAFATLVDAFLPSETKSVLNPFGGIMRITTDMERFTSMDAFEINHDIWSLGMLRLDLSGNLNKVSYKNANIDSWTSKVYDAIVAMPPFSSRIEMHDAFARSKEFKHEEIELVAPLRFIDNTNDDGCCITFVSSSVMWSSGEKAKFREWATKNGYIDTIILLPKNLLSFTVIPVVCVILRKKSLHKGGVRMIDASACFINHQYKNNLSIGQVMEAYHQDIDKVSATVPFEQIAENDYSWNIAEYLHQEEIECLEGYTLARIEDIVSFPQVRRSTDIHSGKVIQVSNLSDDWTHPYVDINAIEKKTPLRGCAMITTDAVLLSTVRNLKPSIIRASEENPTYISQNVLVVIPKDGIDAEYFCMVLAKMEMPTIGMGAPRISKTTLLRQQIAFPSLEQQRSTYKEARNAAMLEQVKSLHLEEVIDQMKADYINEVRSRKHDMMPHLRQISSARKNLEYYLSHKDQFSEEAFISGMKNEVDNQTRAIESLSNLLKIFSRESQFGEPEVINIYDYFVHHYFDEDDYIVDFLPDNVSLQNYGFETTDESYDIDNIGGFRMMCGDWRHFTDTNIHIAQDDWNRLCQNIVLNAKKHGFTDDSRENYFLEIDLTVNQECDMFQIDFVNNGTPLPAGLDKVRYGLRGEKAGVTGGTGEGGYVVKSIVEHYKGDYDIFCEQSGDEYLTTVRILLPIYRADE